MCVYIYIYICSLVLGATLLNILLLSSYSIDITALVYVSR